MYDDAPQTEPSKTDDPMWLHARAKKAAAVRHSVDTYIRSIAARAPELTPEMRARLAAIVRGSAG